MTVTEGPEGPEGPRALLWPGTREIIALLKDPCAFKQCKVRKSTRSVPGNR